MLKEELRGAMRRALVVSIATVAVFSALEPDMAVRGASGSEDIDRLPYIAVQEVYGSKDIYSMLDDGNMMLILFSEITFAHSTVPSLPAHFLYPFSHGHVPTVHWLHVKRRNSSFLLSALLDYLQRGASSPKRGLQARHVATLPSPSHTLSTFYASMSSFQ